MLCCRRSPLKFWASAWKRWALFAPTLAATPYDRGTFSSRVTFYTGMAVKKAAEDAKQQLLEMASKMSEIPASDLLVENERIVSATRPELSLICVKFWRRLTTGRNRSSAEGWYGGKGDYPSLPHKAQGKEYVPGWKYAAQAVEVEIDEETGMVKIRKIASAHDVGTTLNPTSVRGQIAGGVVMGSGTRCTSGSSLKMAA